MAVRKTKAASRSVKGSGGKKTPSPTKKKSYSWAILFWLAFVIAMFGLYIFNRDAISSSIQTIKKEISSRKVPADEKPDLPLTTTPAPPAVPPVSQPAAPASPKTTPAPPASSVSPAPSVSPSAQPPASTAPAPPVPSPSVSSQPPAATSAPKPAVGTPAPQSTKAPAANQPQPAATGANTAAPGAAAPGTAVPTSAVPGTTAAAPSAEKRERALYFSQVDRGGTILRVKVTRNLPVSNSPLIDVIQALIGGPSGEEKSRGLISLIPPETKLMSATVRGDTAYISFSEDFQYNTFGVEGYAGQLRQIVYTATEFPNVKNVQILIEGRRLDYLGEGVWIGSPLDRDML